MVTPTLSLFGCLMYLRESIKNQAEITHIKLWFWVENWVFLGVLVGPLLLKEERNGASQSQESAIRARVGGKPRPSAATEDSCALLIRS